MKNISLFIVGETPVKLVTDETGSRAFAFNWKTGDFEKNRSMYFRIYKIQNYSDIEVLEVTEEKFNLQVSKVENRIEIRKKVPLYCIIEDKAVKLIKEYFNYGNGIEGNSYHAYFFNKEKQEFEISSKYEYSIYGENELEVTYLSLEEFNEYLKQKNDGLII